MPAVFARVRSWVRRILFWLTPTAKTSTEQTPDSAKDHLLVLAVTKPKAVPRWRQIRYAARVLSSGERRTLAISLSLSVVFLIAVFVLLAIYHLTTVPAVGGTYTEALIGEPQTLNPIDSPVNDVDADLVSLIYSGLFRMQGMEPIPDLAKSYEWSEGGKVLTVNLQPNAQFHNGQPVTADDVQFTIESIQDPVRNSLLAPFFRGVKVAVLDDHTVQFVLEQPDVTFLDALTVGILPSDLWQDIPVASARLANYNLKPIGSGPFMVKSFTRDNLGVIRSYTLERSERYYGVKPYIKTVTFQFYADRITAEDALKSDLVDAASFILPSEADKFRSAARWNSVHLEIPQETIAFFNLKDKTLSDLRVRQALIEATNRQDILSAYNNMAEAVDTPYPFLPSASSTAYDLDAARKLLQNAGWVLPSNDSVRVYQRPDNKSTASPVSTPSSTKLTLTITAPDEPDLLKVADLLKRQWSLLGAQVDIQPLDSRLLLKKSSRERNAQIVLWNVLLQPDQDLFPIWWSGQAAERGMNFSGLAEKEVDTLIEQTKAASTTETLAKTREALSQSIMKRAPALFLARPYYAYVISNRVKGTGESIRVARPSDRFQDFSHWYIKTGLRWK